jgi:YD repeat-containing protein
MSAPSDCYEPDPEVTLHLYLKDGTLRRCDTIGRSSSSTDTPAEVTAVVYDAFNALVSNRSAKNGHAGEPQGGPGLP